MKWLLVCMDLDTEADLIRPGPSTAVGRAGVADPLAD